MHPLSDRTERAVAFPPVDAARGTGADPAGNAPITSE
jgi:hypothetical protein